MTITSKEGLTAFSTDTSSTENGVTRQEQLKDEYGDFHLGKGAGRILDQVEGPDLSDIFTREEILGNEALHLPLSFRPLGHSSRPENAIRPRASQVPPGAPDPALMRNSDVRPSRRRRKTKVLPLTIRENV